MTPIPSPSSTAITHIARALAIAHWRGRLHRVQGDATSMDAMAQAAVTEARVEAFLDQARELARVVPLLTLDRTELTKQAVSAALGETNGNITCAAKRLGLSRRTLHRYIDQWPELAPSTARQGYRDAPSLS